MGEIGVVTDMTVVPGRFAGRHWDPPSLATLLEDLFSISRLNIAILIARTVCMTGKYVVRENKDRNWV